jgi:hypothetical protein
MLAARQPGNRIRLVSRDAVQRYFGSSTNAPKGSAQSLKRRATFTSNYQRLRYDVVMAPFYRAKTSPAFWRRN